MSLNSTQRKTLKSKAHTLKPKIKIGKGGLSAEIVKILNQLLRDLSLIKVKVLGDKATRLSLIEDILKLNSCQVVGSVGNSVILYRKNELNLLNEKVLPEDSETENADTE